jgi:hypothetical protein
MVSDTFSIGTVPIIRKFNELFLRGDVGSTYVTAVDVSGLFGDPSSFYLRMVLCIQSCSLLLWEGKHLGLAICLVMKVNFIC